MALWHPQSLGLLRYSVIAPLLDPLAHDEEKRRRREKVLACPHRLPDGRRVRVSAPT